MTIEPLQETHRNRNRSAAASLAGMLGLAISCNARVEIEKIHNSTAQIQFVFVWPSHLRQKCLMTEMSDPTTWRFKLDWRTISAKWSWCWNDRWPSEWPCCDDQPQRRFANERLSRDDKSLAAKYSQRHYNTKAVFFSDRRKNLLFCLYFSGPRTGLFWILVAIFL